MPIIVEVRYEDGSKELVRVPAEIWKQNSSKVSKMIVAEQKIASLKLDPMHELADVDFLNNRWPEKAIEGRVRLKKEERPWAGSNPMSEARDAEAKKKKPKKNKAKQTE